jgi:hypothetical protein
MYHKKHPQIIGDVLKKYSRKQIIDYQTTLSLFLTEYR